MRIHRPREYHGKHSLMPMLTQPPSLRPSATEWYRLTVEDVARELQTQPSRGLSEQEASTLIVSGFIEPLVKELPMEYAVEMNRLIELQMEGSVG